MTRRLPRVLALATGALMLLPVAACAAGPAGAGWSIQGPQPTTHDSCTVLYSVAACERPGGLAANGSTALMAYMDDDGVMVRRSTDGGDTWAPPALVDPQSWSSASLAQDGAKAVIGYYRASGGTHAVYKVSGNMGGSWSAAQGFDAPRQVWADTAVAIRGDVVAFAAAGWDEVPQGRPGAAIKVRVVHDGDAATKTFAFNGIGCGILGMDPSLAITKGGVVVLAYWQTCSKLVVRRSTDFGGSWSAARILSAGTHANGMAIAAKGDSVLLAYTAGGDTLTRFSADRGRTWSTPRQAGSGAASLRLTHGGGAWHLLSGGTVSVRYRTSANGTTWSAGETVDSEAPSRTYAVGIAHANDPMALYVIRGADKAWDLYVATDR